MRLFIAIEIPDVLKKVLGTLRRDIHGARWVPAEQIHLTLAFLGEVDESVVENLNTELARIKLPEFELCFSGAGCFPGSHRPRVLWVGLKPDSHLNDLASRVHASVLSVGIPQEERPFSPHITLARLKLSPSSSIETFLEQNGTMKLPPFRVREFTLFQSRLTSQGAVHIPLKNFPLTAEV